MAEFIAYCRKLQLEAQLPVDQLWSTLWVGVKDKEVREHLIRIREYGRYKGSRLEEICFDYMLSAGKHVESNKESERRIQQARDGHKKSSTKEKSHEKGQVLESRNTIRNPSRQHPKKPQPLHQSQQLVVPRRLSYGSPVPLRILPRFLKRNRTGVGIITYAISMERMGILPKTVLIRSLWINPRKRRLLRRSL